MAYLHPGQDVVDLLGKSLESFHQFASENVCAVLNEGKNTRLVGDGYVVDFDNGGPKLFIRPQGVNHDHWLQYHPESGQLEIQDEDGQWGLMPFDNL